MIFLCGLFKKREGTVFLGQIRPDPNRIISFLQARYSRSTATAGASPESRDSRSPRSAPSSKSTSPYLYPSPQPVPPFPDSPNLLPPPPLLAGAHLGHRRHCHPPEHHTPPRRPRANAQTPLVPAHSLSGSAVAKDPWSRRPLHHRTSPPLSSSPRSRPPSPSHAEATFMLVTVAHVERSPP